MAWTANELDAGASGSPPAASRGAITPSEDGSLHLPAHRATTYGRELAYRPSLDVLAPWRHEHDVAEWHVTVAAPGAYRVLVTLAADDASAGDRFVVAAEGSQVSGVVESSGGYESFREYECGVLDLARGTNRIIMRPDGALRRELADVRSLRLVPVRRAGGA
jgi:hypothetical protein